MADDIDVEIRIDPGKPRTSKRFISAMKSGISDGLEESLDYLQDVGKSHAKDVVMLHDRVWTERVKRGFTTETHRFPRWYHHQGQIINTAPHARIVEKGLAPKGQITGSNPSVQDIIGWVDTEVVPNASAQYRAKQANIGNWDPQLQALAVQHGKANVIAAFGIAKHLRDRGYKGIHFMQKTESKLKSQTPNVKHKVEKNIRRKLREKGLS